MTGARGDGSISAVVRATSRALEPDLVRYLRSGYVVVDVMEIRPDVLDGTPLVETGSLMTDGSWYWREDLAHYVEKYHLGLPRAFEEHVAFNEFLVPASDEAALVAATNSIVSNWSAESGRVVPQAN